MKTEFCAEKSVLLGLFAFGLLASLSAAEATAQQGRTFEKNGIIYQERETTVRRPVATMETQERTQLVHRLHVTTENRESHRNYVTPVTNYQWVTQMHGRWNPFVKPYYSQKMLPVTRWESRTEVTQVPVTHRRWVPEIQTRQVQVPSWRMADEKVVSTVAIGVAPSANGTTVARRTPVGGTASLPNSTPRWGSQGTVDGVGGTRIPRKY